MNKTFKVLAMIVTVFGAIHSVSALADDGLQQGSSSGLDQGSSGLDQSGSSGLAQGHG
ncbi:hypothetical protein [Paraburkholderia bannensis]|uniref:hypothetical protein n=1 Tax=Paraburkholderia bannensis TaxID=765414 RepID=UPI002ABE4798|nr:hypothetical protein [Paraburkholderia bannensis]